QTPHCGITAVPCISCSGTAPAGISTLSLHDALPIYAVRVAHAVKALPLQIRSARPLREAISTAGGVGFESLDASLMLTALPGTFAAGEMLDWEAPTGGYLLTACLAQGRWVADGVLRYLQTHMLGLQETWQF